MSRGPSSPCEGVGSARWRGTEPICTVSLLRLTGISLLLVAGCAGPGPREVAPNPPVTATFNAVGDILLSRGVARAIERSGDPQHPFRQLNTALEAVDFNFGNLESPVSGDDSQIADGLRFNTRVSHLAGLVEYDFKIVNLANNHALDQGVDGLVNTWRLLEAHGIRHVGTGPDLDSAWQPRYVEANGIRFGFIGASYTAFNDRGRRPSDQIARINDHERLPRAVRQARADSDFVVVTMHAGREYVRRPDRTQIDFARRAIDAGADIVIGAHPHWIQTIEAYRGKWIFHSLGNFIFDQRKPGTNEGLMLRIAVQREAGPGSPVALARIDLLPLIIEATVPRLATAAESSAILQKIGLTEDFLLPPP